MQPSLQCVGKCQQSGCQGKVGSSAAMAGVGEQPQQADAYEAKAGKQQHGRLLCPARENAGNGDKAFTKDDQNKQAEAFRQMPPVHGNLAQSVPEKKRQDYVRGNTAVHDKVTPVFREEQGCAGYKQPGDE